MATSSYIQYTSYYTNGSAAKNVERKPAAKVSAAPKPVARPAKRVVVRVDPVAVVGIVLAVVMLISLISACSQYHSWTKKNAQMSHYIATLQQEQAALQQEYEAGYDLEQIQEIATAIGMVPAEDAQRITVDVQIPSAGQVQVSLWERITIFLAGLFA